MLCGLLAAGGAVRASYDASVWQTHVLAHLPVYGVLVPLAAEAAAARVRARGQEPAATLLKVLPRLLWQPTEKALHSPLAKASECSTGRSHAPSMSQPVCKTPADPEV